MLRAGLHNPQGRTLALLWLAASASGDMLALLPLDLAGHASRRSCAATCCAPELTISDESAQLAHLRPAARALRQRRPRADYVAAYA